MARPPLPIGGHGDIYTKEISPGRWMARCQYRGADGRTRPVKRHGSTSGKAKQALRAALTTLGSGATSGEINRSTRLHALAVKWLAVQDRRAASNVRARTGAADYRKKYTAYIEGPIGHLMLHECTVARMNDFIAELADRLPATAASCRAVLSGMLGYAVRNGAIATNPIRDTEPVNAKPTRPKQALNADQARDLLQRLERDDEAQRLDLPDLAAMLMATGARPGEVTALHWDDVDLRAGRVTIAWHVVRIKGEGLVRAPGRKGKIDGKLILDLPMWATARLKRRKKQRPFGPVVFPSPTTGGYQDSSVVGRNIDRVRGRIGYPGLTAKVIGRNTVITHLRASGASPVEVADQAGHSDITSQDSYTARGASTARQAAWLEELGPRTGTGSGT